MSEKIFFDEWEYSYSFTQNKGCEYFPCHKIKDENKFSCLFCYCPLYLIADCGGNFSLLPNGMKDCSNCLLPHKQESYQYIVNKLSFFHKN
ncbi:MAG: cysteine-rich small domain-containing protein [Firmicutes bacterium]|nr:cysteine-rich small domain-containing protein [Bacillota bacterium]